MASINYKTVNNEATEAVSAAIAKYNDKNYPSIDAKANAIKSDVSLQPMLFYYSEVVGYGAEGVADMLGIATSDINSVLNDYSTNEVRYWYEQSGDLSNCLNEIEFMVNNAGGLENAIGLAEISETTNLTEEQLRKAYLEPNPIEWNFDNITSGSNISGENLDNAILNKNIYGAPFKLNKVSDPNQTWYAERIFSDMYVCSFYPGLPIMRETIDLKSASKDTSFTYKGASDDGGAGDDSAYAGILAQAATANSKAAQQDQRFYKFSHNGFDQYERSFKLMASTVASKMGLSAAAGLDAVGTINDATRSGGSFLDYIINNDVIRFAPTSVSISEDVSNSFGASNVAGTASQVSDMAKEVNFLLGGNMEKFDAAGDKLAKGVRDKIDDLQKNAGEALGTLLGGASTAVDVLSTAIAGSNVYFPEIWKDSQFSRSINLDFKFGTPYGSKLSILQYVYIPFLLLLALALPREDTVMGYKSPYIFRLDLPGMFTSDMAVITSMSYKKGGEQNLWSKDGFPLEISVSLSIKDLYPVLTLANTGKELAENFGMHLFLDNMAGVSVERFKPGAAFVENINKRVMYVIGEAGTRVDNISRSLGGVIRNLFGSNQG